MKKLFKERVAKATDIVCRQMDKTFAGRLERVIREYDENFGVAIGIEEGVRFILMSEKIILDDMAHKRYVFQYDRKSKELKIDDNDELYEMILSYLAVCKQIDKTINDIIVDIEKKLDIVSSIIDSVPAEFINEQPKTISEPKPPDNEPDFTSESKPQPFGDVEDKANEEVSLPFIPNERPKEEVFEKPHEEPVEDFEEEIEEEFTDEDLNDENEEDKKETVNPIQHIDNPATEAKEDQMARNVVEKARNSFEAMRVLKSLGYSPDDFEKYGISAKDVAEYKQLMKQREAE